MSEGPPSRRRGPLPHPHNVGTHLTFANQPQKGVALLSEDPDDVSSSFTCVEEEELGGRHSCSYCRPSKTQTKTSGWGGRYHADLCDMSIGGDAAAADDDDDVRGLLRCMSCLGGTGCIRGTGLCTGSLVPRL